jgi:hypothetical protein
MKYPRIKIVLLALLLISSITVLPSSVEAIWKPGDPLIPCGQSKKDSNGQLLLDDKKNATIANECGFDDAIQMGRNIMDILFWLAMPLAACLFAYAGLRLLFSGGDEGARKKAKEIMTTAAWGLAIMLVAYVAVYTIATALLYDDYIYIEESGGTPTPTPAPTPSPSPAPVVL